MPCLVMAEVCIPLGAFVVTRVALRRLYKLAVDTSRHWFGTSASGTWCCSLCYAVNEPSGCSCDPGYAWLGEDALHESASC